MKHILFRKNKKNKAVILLASLAVLLMVGVTGTLAYLTAQPAPVINTFTPGNVDPSINETFDGTTKENVSITNEGNVNAYIRAAIVVTWVKETNDGYEVYSSIPMEYADATDDIKADYQITGIDSNWIKGSDGYFYYKVPVAASASTNYLFTECKPLVETDTKKTPNQPEGYTLSVEILGQAIQADGVDSTGVKPVVLAWGTNNGGSVVSVENDGILSIATSSASNE